MGIIEINNLKCKQGDFLLSIDTLNLDSGCIHGLVGKNGAGKTTFLRCIMKLKTFRGDICILGANIKESDQSFLQNIGYVNDENYFNGELTINQLANFMRSIYVNWDNALLRCLMDQYQLTEYCNKKIAHLSKGMGVKLAIAVAISHHPLLYVLDEPTSGVDPIVRIEVLSSLKQYAGNDEATVLFSSHILEDIEDIADTLMILNNGRMRTVNLDGESAFSREAIIEMIDA